jgi:regulatory protein
VLLGSRWRSREELRRRLHRAGFEPTEVEEALVDLEASGLVDDARFARDVVRDQVGRRQAGDRVVRQALRQKGVGDPEIEEALGEAGALGSEPERALAFASRKAGRMARGDPEGAQRRLYGALLRRGYDPGTARDASRRALAEAMDGLDEDEQGE